MWTSVKQCDAAFPYFKPVFGFPLHLKGNLDSQEEVSDQYSLTAFQGIPSPLYLFWSYWIFLHFLEDTVFFHVSHMSCAQPEHFSVLFAAVTTICTSDLCLNVKSLERPTFLLPSKCMKSRPHINMDQEWHETLVYLSPVFHRSPYFALSALSLSLFNFLNRWYIVKKK